MNRLHSGRTYLEDIHLDAQYHTKTCALPVAPASGISSHVMCVGHRGRFCKFGCGCEWVLSSGVVSISTNTIALYIMLSSHGRTMSFFCAVLANPCIFYSPILKDNLEF